MKEKILSTSGIRNFIKIFCVFLGLVLFLAIAQRLLMPKYVGKMAEGALISEYYDSEKNNDVIFLGDSEVYYNFSPENLEKNYELTSYIRGSANQTMCQSYYLLMDTLRYETPEIVVVSVASLMKEDSDSEAYNRMTMDGMKWSSYKYECIKASMLEEESLVSYIFPILRYHSRWSELSKDDLKYFFQTEKVSNRGYIERTEIVPMTKLPAAKPLTDYTLAESAMNYLDMIRQECVKRNIKLILVKSPSMHPYWYEEWDEQVVSYAEEYNLTYVNLLNNIEEIGIDFKTDTFDGGLHLNATGAEKNTYYFGKIISEELYNEY